MSEEITTGIKVEVNRITGTRLMDPLYSITFISNTEEKDFAFQAMFADFSSNILLLKPIRSSEKGDDSKIFAILKQCLGESNDILDSALRDEMLLIKNEKVEAIAFSLNGIPVFISDQYGDNIPFYFASKH